MTALDGVLARDRALVEPVLERWLPDEARAGELATAMRHIVFAGGKRLRASLALLGCRDVGGAPEDALGAAAALEMLHAYSLVHDDLPCMDDASLRRGRPCVHIVHGEALAVLAGDALLTLAFEVLVRATPEHRPVGAMVVTLTEAAGWAGMVGGQVADLAGEGEAADLERVRRIHLDKTAALISAALSLGALAGGGGPDDVRRLGEAGRELGLAFQIVDDLLDLEGDAEQLGKDAGADAGNGKLTWPAVVGRQAAWRDARELAASARRRWRGGRAEALLEELAERVVTRRR